jgi:integrase/recombinase XerD
VWSGTVPEAGADHEVPASDASDDARTVGAPPPLPLDIEEHLTWLAAERGRSVNTLTAYRRDLTAYWAWLAERGLGLDDVRGRDLDAYVGALRERGLAPASVKRALVAVRSLHRFRAEEGLATSDPGAEVETPRVPAGLPKALTEAEIGLLLDQVVGDEPVARRDRALLELLYGTGARISEVCALSLGDVDLDGSLVRLFGKGSKERVVPLGRFARIALAAWLDDAGTRGHGPRAVGPSGRRGGRLPEPAGGPAGPPGRLGGGAPPRRRRRSR